MSHTAVASMAWSSEQLFDHADTYYAQLLDNLACAQRSIDFESYIFDDDRIGQQFITALITAAQRGVHVRVLIDGVGSHASAKQVASTLSAGGVAVRIWSPLPWNFSQHAWIGQRWSSLLVNSWQRFFALLSRINKRNHRKLVVIDSNIAWTGSINISHSHLGSKQGGSGWRDIGVRVTGSDVRFLAQTFSDIWVNRKVELRVRQFRQLFSNHTRRLRWRRHRMLLEMFRDAKQRIWIESAYFAPPGSLLRAMRKARLRGVDVRIIVPVRSDIFFFPALASTWYADLLASGVCIFEYQRNILHSKALIVDDFYLVGSSNFNHRSLFHDLEIDVALNHADTQAQLVAIFRQDIEDSREITLRRMQRYPRLLLLLGWIPRLLRYWL